MVNPDGPGVVAVLVSSLSANPLAQFLRHQRARRRPEEVGISGAGMRRVPGLRRDEVAARAGISIEYYSRLEQGRVTNPSLAVCEALARALAFDHGEMRHLLELVNPSRCCFGEGDPTVPDGVRVLVNNLSVPAVVQNRYTDVIWTNHPAQQLFPNLRVGVNRIRAIFTDPQHRAMFIDWDRAAANCVAQFRLAIGGDVTAERSAQLISELTAESEQFRHLWSRIEVDDAPISPVRLRHPDVGLLELFTEKLHIAAACGLTLVVYHAPPGTASWSALHRLCGRGAEGVDGGSVSTSARRCVGA
ncbi:helix-turn-helix transcriptional regulator [Mycolicibacterium novocastrense]|nr:helix-turn-helix transcriptional regulator [Mycolicibacterium novocastrense]